LPEVPANAQLQPFAQERANCAEKRRRQEGCWVRERAQGKELDKREGRADKRHAPEVPAHGTGQLPHQIGLFHLVNREGQASPYVTISQHGRAPNGMNGGAQRGDGANGMAY